jgi:transcriptional regulator with XRE-family HTH domain
MKAQIVTELDFFLNKYNMSARKLAIAAGLLPNTLTRLLSGKRHDMRSENADRIRAAMRRIECELTPITTVETPNEPEEVNHGLD